MSKNAFQGKITLIDATVNESDPNKWTCTVDFADAEGTFSSYDIAQGDIISFDTSIYENGTFTFYNILTSAPVDGIRTVVQLSYMPTNDNISGAPDMGWFTGQDGVIARPTSNYGLLPVVSRDVQGVTDKFTEYVQNYNFSKIVDNVNLTKRTNSDNVTLTRGMMVYVPEATNNMMRAHGNNTIERARAAGMVMSTTPMGVLGAITCDGTVEMTADEWDVLTGTTGGLLNGKAYFLHPSISGGISAVPPETGFITRVGRALSSTAFDVNIEAPIML